MFGSRINRKNIIQTIHPAIEPISLADMKSFLLVDNNNDDQFITMLIKAARQGVEKYLNRSLITQQWKLILDRFPENNYISLPYPEVQTIDSITAYNLDNSTATVNPSIYTLASNKAILNYCQVWEPLVTRDRSGVEVLYTAGYGDSASDVPEAIILAIMLWCSSMFYARGLCDMPTDCKTMLSNYRVYASGL